jgi:peptidoglycan hydrolase-like protein with peptidoglycan-binding domain
MSTFPRARRAARRSLAAVVVIGAAVAGIVAVDRARPDEETEVAAEPLQIVTAERTDLSADATLEGTVESSSSLTVLHRIEGATPSTGSATTGSATVSGPAPASGASAQGVAFVHLQPAAPETAAPETTMPETTVPETTVPETVPDSMGPDPTVPGSTQPPTTPAVPSTTTPVDSTVPVETTSPEEGTVPADGRSGEVPSGGALPGGPVGTGSDAASEPTTSITERVTSLPAVGAAVAFGDVLYTVDGRPVIALAGTLPAWRSLSTASDDGPDIAQLELSLAALGYDADGALVIDNEYDSATANAVEAWQRGLGLDATGELELGDVVFLPDTVTVTALETSVGADVTEADPILQVSGDSWQVVAPVTEDAVAAVVPGLPVTVGADAGSLDAVVTLLRSVAAEDGTITAEAVISPTAATNGPADGSTVDVTVAIGGPADAITVPAEAIVSRLDGTYAVEVRDDSGDHWVTVEVLDLGGSQVAVSGIDAGAQVLVPA